MADFVLLGGVVSIILVLLATMEHHRRRQEEENRRRRRASPQLAQPGRRLSPDDERILSRLGWLMRNPRNRHRLLDDPALFLKAARRAIREGIATERELMDFARRVGLTVDHISSDRMSTLKLSAGVEVSVADDAMNSGAGTVAAVHGDSLRIRLRRGYTAFGYGTRLDVVCNSNQGLFRFSSVVKDSSGKVLHLDHTDRIDHVQRREHLRHDIEIPVQVGEPGGALLPSRTDDLSIGGAAVKNPKRTFVAGAQLTVRVERDGLKLALPGRVIRTSRGSKILHVQFDGLPESTRHKLFRTIMSASAGQKSAKR
ncbi:MAG: PilZ domain-containing protein [Alkalispirochaeta sp.]